MPDEAVTHTSTTSSDSEVVYSVSSEPTRTPAAAVCNKIALNDNCYTVQCISYVCVYVSDVENCEGQKIQVDIFLKNAKLIIVRHSVYLVRLPSTIFVL